MSCARIFHQFQIKATKLQKQATNEKNPPGYFQPRSTHTRASSSLCSCTFLSHQSFHSIAYPIVRHYRMRTYSTWTSPVLIEPECKNFSFSQFRVTLSCVIEHTATGARDTATWTMDMQFHYYATLYTYYMYLILFFLCRFSLSLSFSSAKWNCSFHFASRKIKLIIWRCEEKLILFHPFSLWAHTPVLVIPTLYYREQ